MSKPPKIVIPGLNRGAGIPGGYVVGRRRGTKQGPAELLDLTQVRGQGIATVVQVTQAVASLSTAVSTTVGAFNPAMLLGGDAGEDGAPGPPGPAGAAGAAGSAGATGPQGAPGFGMDGADGEEGMAIPGVPGAAGAAGSAGATGPQGAPGFGMDGADGEEGMAIPGVPGATGASGTSLTVGSFDTTKTAFTDVGNLTTFETGLFNWSAPAGQLASDGDRIVLTASGTFVSSASATRQIKAACGGTTIFDSGALTINVSGAVWAVTCEVMRTSSTSVRCTVDLETEGAALASYTSYTEVTGLTLSGALNTKVTGTAAGVGAASNDIVCKMGAAEFKPSTPDVISSSVQGDILYRNATVWTRLPAGTSGQVLQTNGAGANPSWVTAATSVSASIRSSSIQSSSATTFTVSFPAGAAAGDLVILICGSGFGFATPIGWTVIDQASQSNFLGNIFTRTLTTTDINNGSVTLTQGGAFNAVICAICFTGAPTIKNISSNHNATGAGTRTVTIATGFTATDFAVYFGLNRNASADTLNLGSAVQSINAASASGVVTAGTTGSTSLSLTASYGTTTGTTGDYQGIIVLSG